MTEAPPKSILSDDHINAIGRLVVAVSKIDTLLTDLTAAFLQSDIVGTIAVVHHQQIASKVSTLLALVKMRLRGLDGMEEIANLITRAGTVAEERNRLVHAYWHVSEDGTVYAVRFHARGEFKRSRRPVAAESIQQHVREADEIADQLMRLRDRLLETNSQPRRNPETPTPPSRQ